MQIIIVSGIVLFLAYCYYVALSLIFPERRIRVVETYGGTFYVQQRSILLPDWYYLDGKIEFNTLELAEKYMNKVLNERDLRKSERKIKNKYYVMYGRKHY